LEEVLGRAKFARRLAAAGIRSLDLVMDYAAFARVVHPADIPPVIADDPDDDEVLACAVGSRAEVIISGDSHLLDLGGYQHIRIVTVADFLSGYPSQIVKES
jgi:predicted nucleic acid-binding protein